MMYMMYIVIYFYQQKVSVGIISELENIESFHLKNKSLLYPAYMDLTL